MRASVRWVSLPLVVFCLASVSALAQQTDPQLAQNLKRLSIEELTQLDITTASRRVEPLAQVAAAVSVIRGEDIRRSGAANLAEALRLADGIAVARADNETWAISTRGFNISTANKLLVLIDGRTVYSPLYRRHLLVGPGCPADRHRPYRGDTRARAAPCGAQTPSTASSTSSPRARRTRRGRRSWSRPAPRSG